MTAAAAVAVVVAVMALVTVRVSRTRLVQSLLFQAQHRALVAARYGLLKRGLRVGVATSAGQQAPADPTPTAG